MLLARQKDFDAAGDDLLTCHRLLRKLAAYAIGQYAIESRTAEMGLFQTELKLLNSCRPTKGQIERFEKQWNELPPMPGIVDRIDVGDRFRFLDAVCVLSRQGPSALQQLFGDFSASSDDGALQTAVADNLFDWNEPLRSGNQWFDKQTAICRISDRKQREKALQESRQELQTMKNEAGRACSVGCRRNRLEQNRQRSWGPRCCNCSMSTCLARSKPAISTHCIQASHKRASRWPPIAPTTTSTQNS
jgi:hypothetical protein